MRVAVDARTVYSPVRRGTGKNLIDLYQRVARLRPDWEFLMLHRQAKVADDPFAAEPNVTQKAVEIKGDRWNAWEQIRLPVAAFTARATVLHAPANTAPRVPLVKMVMTIHDLIPVDMPEHTAGSRAWVANVGGAARVARRILTPSHYTKDRLMGHFGLPADRIVVNHWAPDGTCERVTDPSVIDAARARQGLRPGQPYVFGFGAVDPRKNTQRIVEAWASLGEGIRSKVALLLVGLLTTAVSTMLNYALAPHAEYARKTVLEDPKSRRQQVGLVAQIFRNRTDNRTWFIRQFKPGENSFTTVHIVQQDANDNIVTNYIATSVLYHPETRVWELQFVKVVHYDETGNVKDSTLSDSLMIKDWRETPLRLSSANMRAEYLSVPELRDYLGSNADFPPTLLAPFATHLQYRMALPWTCLVIAFIATALGIGYSRRGILSSVAAAIIIVFSMNFVTHLFLALGEGARIPDWAAAWTPNVLFGALGLVLLYYRATNRDPPRLNPFG
jgi:lipopolysaccharide export LptBFGC system permease protein LptF